MAILLQRHESVLSESCRYFSVWGCKQKCTTPLFRVNSSIFSSPQWDTCPSNINKAEPWLRRLVAGLSPRRPGFDPGSVHVGFVVDKVALGQGFPRVVRFSSVNVIPPVLHDSEKRKKLIIFVTGLHNKPEGCGASVASAAGSFTKKIYISTIF
jgi:hypothetical protein